MAMSHQCLRESQAPQFDYYSTTKKTASALKKRVRSLPARRTVPMPLDVLHRSHQYSEEEASGTTARLHAIAEIAVKRAFP
jgi:hypothetical protein